MKVIKSRLDINKTEVHKINQSLATQYKYKSIVEWNKFKPNEGKEFK